MKIFKEKSDSRNDNMADVGDYKSLIKNLI